MRRHVRVRWPARGAARKSRHGHSAHASVMLIVMGPLLASHTWPSVGSDCSSVGRPWGAGSVRDGRHVLACWAVATPATQARDYGHVCRQGGCTRQARPPRLRRVHGNSPCAVTPWPLLPTSSLLLLLATRCCCLLLLATTCHYLPLLATTRHYSTTCYLLLT